MQKEVEVEVLIFFHSMFSIHPGNEPDAAKHKWRCKQEVRVKGRAGQEVGECSAGTR